MTGSPSLLLNSLGFHWISAEIKRGVGYFKVSSNICNMFLFFGQSVCLTVLNNWNFNFSPTEASPRPLRLAWVEVAARRWAPPSPPTSWSTTTTTGTPTTNVKSPRISSRYSPVLQKPRNARTYNSRQKPYLQTILSYLRLQTISPRLGEISQIKLIPEII